jgi:glyoxylase-like metal-dependent hydrolase (beta-lactamase superfamily II)
MLLAAPVLLAGCAAPAPLPAPPPPASPAPVTITTAGGIKVHAIQTGWVQVKRRHRTLSGPAALRLPGILLDQAWTPWLPILCYAIEHPEGLILVDTGETARTADPAYFGCSAGDAFFYTRNLRFALGPEDEVGPQLRRLGLTPERVRWVVMTHLHADHTGGMPHLPRSRFILNRMDAAGHRGTLACRFPEGLEREAVALDGPPLGAFSASRALTRDGAVQIVPTPGHSPGHQSVLLRERDRSWLFAGDATFDAGQVERMEVAGIVEDVGAARDSLTRLRRQLALAPTVLLPAHDPEARRRLRDGTVTGLDI